MSRQAARYNCPMSIGSLDILQFVYASGPDVTLSVDVGGCSFVSNGQDGMGRLYSVSGSRTTWEATPSQG